MLTQHIIRTAVEAALAEDAPYGDITCETTIPADETGSAHLTARERGVMSGIAVFTAAFTAQNPGIGVSPLIADGERFQRGQILATVEGPVRDLLAAERIALNFTQRMSGIATMTASFVDAVNAIYDDGHDGTVTRPHRYERTRIVDTRKTTPGLRPFEKYAVVCGGGHNHRYGLSDAVMMKDNHLAALAARGIDLTGAIRHVREQVGHTTHIEGHHHAGQFLARRHPSRRGYHQRQGHRGSQRQHEHGARAGRGRHRCGRDLSGRADAQCTQHRPRIGLELAMADTPNASGEPDELYLDAAATEPVTRNVIEAMMPFMTDAYANPASVHQPGKTAARALDAARASFAAGLGARPDDVIFTSGGTESDNLAIKGIAMARMRALGLQPVYGLAGIDDEPSGVNPAQAGEHPAIRRPRIIISSIEHPAVAQSAQWLHEWFGFEVVHIPVDGQAHLDLDALEQELDGEAGERTTLVSAILANNEVGTVEPVEELVRIAHAHGVPIHVDAVQAAGQIPIRMRDWDVDALSVSGHKFGTPKGLGALLVRGRTPIEPVLSGGGQERGLRSGTQNVAGAVALAIGLNESNARMAAQYRELTDSRDMLIDAVRRVVPRAELTGDPVSRLPGHASFIFPGVTGEALLVDLDARGIAASSGSACAIGRHEIPGTLLAMGLEPQIAKSALRMTFRRPLTREEIERISMALEDSYTELTH